MEWLPVKMSFMKSHFVGACLAFCLALNSTRAGVVINEIFYNGPDEEQNVEFVELYNPSDAAVNLSGWRLDKDVEFTFPAGTTLAADGYLVLAAEAESFRQAYGTDPAGVFKGRLGHRAGRIRLVNAKGKKVDQVRYKDQAPWPTGADGYSASLERICPMVDGEKPENWAASPLPPDEPRPSGTPGKRNVNYAAVLPPVIAGVTFLPERPLPGQAVTVRAEVKDASGVGEVTVRFRGVSSPGADVKEMVVPMTGDGPHYVATIPGQANNQLVRFVVQATNRKGATRVWPAMGEPRPAVSFLVHEPFQLGKVPLAFVMNTDANEAKSMEKHLRSPNQRGFTEEDQIRMMTRMQLEAGLDLAPVWFELAGAKATSIDRLAALRTVITNRAAVAEKLITETLESGDLKEKAKTIPDLARTFQNELTEDLAFRIDEAQKKRITGLQDEALKAIAGGPRGFTADMLLKRFLNLESSFYRITTRADITQAQLERAADLFRSAVAQRAALTNIAQALIDGRGDFMDFREKTQTINEDIAKKLKGVLTADQNRDWSRWRKQAEAFMPGQGRSKEPQPPQGRSAFLYVDPQTREAELYDFVTVTERNAGLNIHFHKDRLFRKMSTLNVLFESNDRFVLAEPLAYEFYRRLDNAAPLAGYLRLQVDGNPMGYYEYIEQPNRSFLQRNRLGGDGNLYKILWFESGVTGQHEKKTNRQSGHDDIVQLVDLLEKSKANPDEQWAVIRKHFNVEQVINYFAANMCLSHWDGFFNNYFTYHDPVRGKWEMYPWDQDKTWGFYDGLPEGEQFYDMPITFGMEGDIPPGWPKDRPAPRGFGEGPQWWRPGGYFSKPLLANPQFRKHFLARTREILDSIYTERVFFPLIDSTVEQLRDEVRLRAELRHEPPEEAVERLKRNAQSLKEHLLKRRKFLLEQDEIRSAGKYVRSELN